MLPDSLLDAPQLAHHRQSSNAGVFFTTKLDGSLDIWDVFFKQNEPTFSMQVNESGLHCLRIESSGRFVATGARDGSTMLMDLCEGLYQPQGPEKARCVAAAGQLILSLTASFL